MNSPLPRTSTGLSRGSVATSPATSESGMCRKASLPRRALALLLPFQAMIHTPLQIYSGTLNFSEILRALLLQVVWALVLWFAARRLWLRALRTAELSGG